MDTRNSNILHWAIILGAPLFFFLWNSSKYNGPAILTDEIGYLSNAIFLAGHPIDGGSSYHAGFSVLLSPLFLLFHDTETIWKGAMLINSALWSWSFYLTHLLITHWSREASTNRRSIILLLVSIYPTWVTISGYVFTSSLFTSVFMTSLLLFISVIKNGGKGIYFFTTLTGILYWIHPIGMMVAGASIIGVIVWGFQSKKPFYLWIAHSIGCLALIFLYKNLLHPIISNAMTPEGYIAISHYPTTSKIFSEIKNASFWLQLAVHSLGQVAYLFVSSLGIALLGGLSLFSYIINRDRKSHEKWRSPVSAYIILSLLGIIFIGAINFSLLPIGGQRSDHWIYGRYLDNVSMPILAIGILALIKTGWRARLSYIPACSFFVLLAGLTIALIHKTHPPIAYSEIISIPSFWPHYSFPEMKDVGLWLLIGSAGITFVYMAGEIGFYVCMPIVFFLGLIYQTKYHKEILNNYAAPTSIVDIIKENDKPRASISFDLDSANGKSLFFQDRISIYKYYLYNHRYHRVSKSGWESDDSDWILTYHPFKYTHLGFEVAKEIRSGLSLLRKRSDHQLNISENSNRGVILKIDNKGHISEGITFHSKELINWSRIGSLRDESIYSENRNGYLFYGPYLYLNKGEYKLTIYGHFPEVNSAILDIFSASRGGMVFLKENLSNHKTSSGSLDLFFPLPEDVPSLEIRLLVTSRDRLYINRYVIEKIEKDLSKN